VGGEKKMTRLQKWFLIAALWVVILALNFSFYWNQIRPVNIRRICAKKAGEASRQIQAGDSNIHEFYRAIYSDCCRNNGLKE